MHAWELSTNRGDLVLRPFVTPSCPRLATRSEPSYEVESKWSIIALGAILLVSTVTHRMNLAGFPPLLHDEGVYASRALLFTQQGILYEPGRGFLGHPFIGWVFLSGLFTVLGFPGSVAPALGNGPVALQNYYSVLRAAAVFTAIVSTLLVYLIASRAFRGRRYGLFAAALFAVTPSSVWYFRFGILDVLMAMWILLAIHLALVARDGRSPLVAALSGAAYGLALLTKLPALAFLPVFGAIFYTEVLATLGIVRKGEPLRSSLRLTLPWALSGLAVASLWLAYAVSTESTGKLIKGLLWHAGMAGGYSFPGLMDYLFSLDPVLFVLGVLGIGLTAAKKNLFGATFGLVYFILLALLRIHWDFYIAPLIPVLAILGGPVLVDAVAFLTSGSRRGLPGVAQQRRPRLAGFPLAAALVALLLVPLPFTASMLTQDTNWADIQASDYIMREAQPYSLVVANTPFAMAIRMNRPDLWVLNWWDGGFQVLSTATHNAMVRNQTVQIRTALTGEVVFNGTVVGQAVHVQLRPGDYVAEGTKFDVGSQQVLSAGRVPIHLDRNLGLIFLANHLPPAVLADRNSPPVGGAFTITLLDPVAMPKVLLVDDQAWVDAQKIPFLRETLGRTDPVLYAANNEQSTHKLSLPEGMYSIQSWVPGGRSLGPALVKLDSDKNIVIYADATVSSPEGIEAVGSLDSSRLHSMVVLVQQADGLPVPWAWVEVQQVEGVAFYVNGVKSAEVRMAAGA